MLKNEMKIRGFARVQIIDRKTGKIEGDSGWLHNTITQTGFQDGITKTLAKSSGSTPPTHMVLSTIASDINSTATDLANTINVRKAGTVSIVSSRTLQLTCQFSSSDTTGAATIGSIGMYGTSSGGSLLSQATFATSQLNTNQDCNATYQWRF